jgi:hypothetical protein
MSVDRGVRSEAGTTTLDRECQNKCYLYLVKWIITWLVTQHGILVVVALQKLQYQLAETTKEKIGVSIDHDLLFFPQYDSYVGFFYYTHR